MIEYYFLTLFSGFLSLFPPHVLETVARAIAIVSYSFFGVRRKLIQQNLDKAFGDTLNKEEKQKLGLESVYHFLLNILESFAETEGKLSDKVTKIEGLEHIEKALAQGKGVYVLCMHMGNWEVMGAAMTHKICPAHVIVKKVGSKGVNRFVEEKRNQNGFYFIKREKKGDVYRAIQDILDKNEIVGFTIDQARPGEPQLPFFGHPAKTNTSFAAIWMKRKAPIVPAFIYRSSRNQHTIKCLTALDLEPSTKTDPQKTILAYSERFNKSVEECVRERPEQYFWMHNRWKS